MEMSEPVAKKGICPQHLYMDVDNRNNSATSVLSENSSVLSENIIIIFFSEHGRGVPIGKSEASEEAPGPTTISSIGYRYLGFKTNANGNDANICSTL